MRVAVFGVLTYALGLIPFYLLTPVHRAVPAVISQVNRLSHAPSSESSPVAKPRLPSPTAIAWAVSAATASPVPTVVVPSPTPRPAEKIGADVASVVDATPQAVPPVPAISLGSSRFAFLLLGYGGGGHDGAYLTDSMMVVIVDPPQRTLTLLSLPRDSWVPLYFDGATATYNKVNTAYAFAQDPSLFPERLSRYRGDQGAGNFAMDTVSRLLGIPIQYYLGLDFQGFREMIDAVGGIDINVPDGFAARYPVNDDPSIDASWTIVRFEPGVQHMDGERAIEYARARETIDNSSEGSDFARSRRQRLIIEAFKARLLQPGGLIHLPHLLAIASQHVDTNYTVPDAAQLSQLILGWKDVKIYQTALTTNNYLEDATGPAGTYIAVPNSPDHSWAQIRAFARRLWQDPAVGVATAATTVVVENDTGLPGVASRITDDLIRLGYNVGAPTSGTVRVQSRLLGQSGAATSLVAQQLEKDLGLAQLDVADPPESDSNTLILQLGTDEANLTVSVPDDPSAPFSTVGVVAFGIWPYPGPVVTSSPESSPVITFPSQQAGPSIVSPHSVITSSLPNAMPMPVPSPTMLMTVGSNTIIVPNLIGLPLADAEQRLTQLGLSTGDVSYRTLKNARGSRALFIIPPGAVLSELPAPGYRVPRGTKIGLTVRK